MGTVGQNPNDSIRIRESATSTELSALDIRDGPAEVVEIGFRRPAREENRMRKSLPRWLLVIFVSNTRDRSLPFRAFDENRRVTQANIVSNKRLGVCWKRSKPSSERQALHLPPAGPD